MSSTHTQSTPRTDTRRPRSFGQAVRTVVMLFVAASALLVFIALLGDVRRKQNTLAQMNWHVDTYAARMADTVQLPLNLDPDIPPARKAVMIKVRWIGRNDARALRTSDEPVFASYSTRIPQVLGRDGRAVIVFEGGTFRVEWMPVDVFDAAIEQQRERIERAIALP